MEKQVCTANDQTLNLDQISVLTKLQDQTMSEKVEPHKTGGNPSKNLHERSIFLTPL